MRCIYCSTYSFGECSYSLMFCIATHVVSVRPYQHLFEFNSQVLQRTQILFSYTQIS